MLLTIILLLFIIVLILIHRINENYKYFQRQGIDGPKHEFFFGHWRRIWSTKRYSKQLEEWTKRYGSIYGLYQGRTPVYVVSDLNFLKEIYLKQFSSFHSRSVPFLARMGKGTPENLFGSSGAIWRRQRMIIGPTFSSNKLRSILPIIQQSIEIFIDQCSSYVNSNQIFNIYEMYQRMTMDIIWRSGFGIESNMQQDPNNLYLKKSSQVIQIDFDQLLIVKLSQMIPSIKKYLIQYFLFQMKLFDLLTSQFPYLNRFLEELPPFWIINRAKQIVDHRYQEVNNNHHLHLQSKRIDLLQMMIDANQNQNQNHENDHLKEKQVQRKELFFEEIVGNILIFMIAGYETTSTTLAYCTYVLSIRNDIQQKLYNFLINNNKKDNIDDDDDDLLMKNDNYMNLFLREILRMYPIIVRATSRECNETTNICGYQIEKGSIIQPDIYSIHFNQEFWGPEDPYEFLPERHLTKRDSLSLMSFGIGPRNCIGMRLALLELKLILKELLINYEIHCIDENQMKSELILEESSVIHPDKILVRLKKRNEIFD